MCAGTLYDAGSPIIEVRIYRDDRLVVWESCGSQEEAAAIAQQASGLDHVYVLVDDAAWDDGPGDVVTHEEPPAGGDVDQPLASLQPPGYGTE